MQTSLSKVNFLELEVFLAASNLRSLRDTSRVFGLSVGQVSKLVRNLERKLGKTLFVRSTKGMQLTREGLDLLTSVKGITELAQGLQPAGLGRRDRLIAVGASNLLGTHLIAPGLARHMGRFQGTRFRLLEFSPPHLVKYGVEGAFQVALHFEALPWTGAWESVEIGAVASRLYVRPDHPLGAVSLEAQVLKYPFAVPTYWAGFGALSAVDYCPVPWEKRLRGIETETADMAIAIVRQSQHLIFVPEIAARAALARGDLREVKVKGWRPVKRPLHLSVRSDLISKKDFDSMCQVLKP